MKIGFTGGTGFVGSYMLRRFVNAGHTVTALVRGGESTDKLPESAISFVHGDITDPETLLGAFDGCDIVVNLVGIIREAGGATFDHVHVQGSANVVAAAKASGVRKFVQMSSCGTRPGAKSRYHITKWQAEEVVRGSGMEWVILRPSLIFGKGDGFTSLLIDLVKKAPIIPIIGAGSNLMQPIAIEDVTSTFLAAVEDDAHNGHTYELGGPERLRFKDIVRMVARQMGSHKLRIHVPLLIVSPVTYLMSRITSRFPLTPDQMILLQEDNIAEPNDVEDVFNLTLVPFSEGLKKIMVE